MRKQRKLVIALGAATALVAAAVGVAYLVAIGSAGAVLAICLVGLGPALAAVALVGALSLMAPPAQSVLASTVTVGTDTAVESQS